jgi:hypothetical protein
VRARSGSLDLPDPAPAEHPPLLGVMRLFVLTCDEQPLMKRATRMLVLVERRAVTSRCRPSSRDAQVRAKQSANLYVFFFYVHCITPCSDSLIVSLRPNERSDSAAHSVMLKITRFPHCHHHNLCPGLNQMVASPNGQIGTPPMRIHIIDNPATAPVSFRRISEV